MGGEMITDEVDSGYINAQSTLKGYCACFFITTLFFFCVCGFMSCMS